MPLLRVAQCPQGLQPGENNGAMGEDARVLYLNCLDPFIPTISCRLEQHLCSQAQPLMPDDMLHLSATQALLRHSDCRACPVKHPQDRIGVHCAGRAFRIQQHQPIVETSVNATLYGCISRDVSALHWLGSTSATFHTSNSRAARYQVASLYVTLAEEGMKRKGIRPHTTPPNGCFFDKTLAHDATITLKR